MNYSLICRASVKHGQSLYSAALTGDDGALLKTVCMDTIDDNDVTGSVKLSLKVLDRLPVVKSQSAIIPQVCPE